MAKRNRIEEFKESADGKAIFLAFAYLIILAIIVLALLKPFMGMMNRNVDSVIASSGPSLEQTMEVEADE